MARLGLKRKRVQAVLSGVSALVTKRSADIQGFALNRRTSGRLGVDGLRGGLRNVMRLHNGTTVLVRVTSAEDCTRRRFAIAEDDGLLDGDDSEVKRSHASEQPSSSFSRPDPVPQSLEHNEIAPDVTPSNEPSYNI